MRDRRTTRRDVLRATAAATTGVLAGSAGCLDVLEDDPAAPDPLGPATDLDLLPSPSAFGGTKSQTATPSGSST